MSYYDDFYNEPSEFYGQVEEFKESLMGSVKEDFLNKMERLEKENQELQEVKKNLDKIERECEQKKTEYDRAIQNAEIIFRRAKLEELFENYKSILYMPIRVRLYDKKCNKCDENRDIEMTLPSGKKVYDECECCKWFRGYIPKSVVLYRIYKDSDDINLYYNYFEYCDENLRLDEYYDGILANDRLVKQGTKIEDITTDESHKLLFSSEEECLAYCEHLNKKDGIPNNAIYDLMGSIIRKGID